MGLLALLALVALGRCTSEPNLMDFAGELEELRSRRRDIHEAMFEDRKGRYNTEGRSQVRERPFEEPKHKRGLFASGIRHGSRAPEPKWYNDTEWGY